ncbi:MAG: LysM peptidoglycan-binding domain-containing protein [Clostridia bacterium]|nr:LysM peptidoglycan-binding domain-containing protein [Clostridia bacterium]
MVRTITSNTPKTVARLFKKIFDFIKKPFVSLYHLLICYINNNNKEILQECNTLGAIYTSTHIMKDLRKTFTPLTLELVALLNDYYSLAKKIDWMLVYYGDTALTSDFRKSRELIQETMLKIIETLEQLIERSLIIHTTSSNDTLWKVSKKYKCDMMEVYELNNLKDVMPFKKGIVILIPIAKNSL